MLSLVSTSDANVYRMNTAIGEIWLVTGERMQKVAQSDAMALEVGRMYFIARNRPMWSRGAGGTSEPIPNYSAI